MRISMVHEQSTCFDTMNQSLNKFFIIKNI